jgi:hypothetical protein
MATARRPSEFLGAILHLPAPALQRPEHLPQAKSRVYVPTPAEVFPQISLNAFDPPRSGSTLGGGVQKHLFAIELQSQVPAVKVTV